MPSIRIGKSSKCIFAPITGGSHAGSALADRNRGFPCGLSRLRAPASGAAIGSRTTRRRGGRLVRSVRPLRPVAAAPPGEAGHVSHLPAAARQLEEQPDRGACGGLGPADRGQGSDVRRHLVHGAHGRRQDESPGVSRRPHHYALELPLGAGKGRGLGRGAARARAVEALEGHLARPARSGSRDHAGENPGRSPAARQHSAAGHFLERAGGARAHRRTACLQAAVGNGSPAHHQHERDRSEGRFGRALLPPLRRMDGSLLAPGPVEGLRSPLRPQGQPGQGAQGDHRRQERRSDDGRIGVGPEGSQAVPEDQAGPRGLHGHRAVGADRRQRPAELPGDSGNAAPLRRKHVGTRVQGHRQPEHLRAHRGTLVQRAGHVRAVGLRRSREPAGGLREDSRRQPDGEREGFGARNATGEGGRGRGLDSADGHGPADRAAGQSDLRRRARR